MTQRYVNTLGYIWVTFQKNIQQKCTQLRQKPFTYQYYLKKGKIS